MRRITLLLCLVLTARVLKGDCTGSNLSIRPLSETLTATFEKAPDLEDGEEVSIAIGSSALKTRVDHVAPNDLGTTTVTFEQPDGSVFKDETLLVDADSSTDSAKLTFTDSNGKEQSVDLCLIGQFSSSSETMHVGMAQASEDKGTAATNPTALDDAPAPATEKPSAIRVQYGRSYRRFREVSTDSTKIPSMRNMEQDFAVSIDTTDKKDKGFVDDNKISAGLYWPRFNVGDALNRARFGVDGQHARTLHGGDHNADVTLTFDGWLPLFQAITVGGGSRYLATPLQFSLSAGRRWQNVDKVKSSGNVAKGSLLYHLYLAEGYRMDLEYDTVFNDVSHRPASTPRTQHSWKASLFMFGTADSKFTAVASYEDGHSGPVFTKLKQYFVGVGLQNLFTAINKTN